MINETPLIKVSNLVKHYKVGKGRTIQAVNGVSFEIMRGSTFGLVGESGSGKSTIAKLIMRLEEPTSGGIEFDGVNLLSLKGKDLQRSRKDLQMVFQNPFDALNRRKRVKDIIGLPISVHTEMSNFDLKKRTIELLELVGLRPEMMDRFPHEMSGGQCQRVGIARAIALNPRILILDESVSAVDVSIQAQILNLLRDLQQKLNLTYLFISHDLSIVRYMSHRVAVLYQGEIAEYGDRNDLFAEPLHPYTHTLMNSIPNLFLIDEQFSPTADIGDDSQAILPGECRFRNRCVVGYNLEKCKQQIPTLRNYQKSEQLVACHFPVTSAQYKAAVQANTSNIKNQSHIVASG